jgi:hypothetical protein
MPLPDADSDDPPAHWLADTGQVDGPPEHWLALLREHKAEWLLDVAGEGRIGNPDGRIGNPDGRIENPDTEPDPYQLTGTGANTLAPPDAWLPDLQQGFLFFLEAFGFSPPEDSGDEGQIVAEKEHGKTAEPPHSPQPTNAPERPSGLKGEQPVPKQPFLEALTSQLAPGEGAEPEQAANIGDKSSQEPAWTPPTLSAAPTQVIQRWRLPEQEAAPVEGSPLTSILAELPPARAASVTGPIEPPPPRYPIQRAEDSAPPSSEIGESMETERPPMPPAQPADPEAAVSHQAHKPSERTPTAVDSPQLAGPSLAASRETIKRPAAPDRGVHPPILSLPAQETPGQSSTRPHEAEQIAPPPIASVEERAMILTSEPIIQRPPAAAGTNVPYPGRVTRLQLHYSPPQPPQRPMTAEVNARPAPQSGQQSQESHISGGEPDPVERPVNTTPPQIEYQAPIPRPPERRERPERVRPLKPPETAERRQTNLAPPPAEPPQSSKQEPWPELPKGPRLVNLGQSRRRNSNRRRRLDSEQRGRRWNG